MTTEIIYTDCFFLASYLGGVHVDDDNGYDLNDLLATLDGGKFISYTKTQQTVDTIFI